MGRIGDFLERRRQKKASEIVEGGMLDSYRESEEIRKAESLKKEADRLVHLKQYKTAIEEYHKALDQYPYKIGDELFQKSADFLFIIHYNLGTTHALLKNFMEALGFFDTSLRIEKTEDDMKTKALSAKGNCYLRAKKFIDQVKEKHTKEITLDGEFQKEEKVAEELKRIDQKENLIKKAHECYSKAVELEKSNPDLWYQKGYIEFLLGMVKESIASFDAVLTIEDNYANKENIELFNELKREKGLEILEKQERAYKTKTGHYVKNKTEKAIADFLFDNNLLFQYNMAITWTDLDLNANFYIPQLELYLEHFKQNHSNINMKIDEYKKNDKRLIYTTSDDEINIEETLKLKMKDYITL